MHYATSRKVAGSSPEKVDFFLIDLIFQLHYGPGVDSAFNRNDCQESSWGGKWWQSLTTSLPSVSRLSEENVGASMSHKPMGLHGLLQGWLYFTSLPTVSRLSRENVGASMSHKPMGLHGLLQR
jgi:hypothetical protein